MRRLAVLAAVFGLLAIPSQSVAAGVPSNWDRGVNFTSWWHDQYGSNSAATSLANAQSHTKANAIAVIATLYQSSPTANTMAPNASATPSDTALRTIIQRAHARGMKVLMRPMMHVESGGSLSNLAPSSPSTWFANYRAHVYRYAELAQAAGAESFSVGAELRPMTVSKYTAEWRTLIAGVRARYSGKITYGAVTPELRHIEFWDALDFIGVDAYYALGDSVTPDETTIASRWHSWTTNGYTVRYIDELAALAARFAKPVVFTEVGFTSTTDNLVRPWLPGGTYDAAAQVRALNATIAAFADKPWFRGMYIWQWHADPNRGGSGDTDHILNNKPAQDAVGKWFGATSDPVTSPLPEPEPLPAPEPEPVPAPEPAPLPAPEPAPAPVPAPAPEPDPVVVPEPTPPANQAPSVRLDEPVADQTFDSRLVMSATASDDVGVARVDFLVDGKVVRSDYGAPYTYSWRVKRLAYGRHVVTARAVDAAGAAAEASAPVTRSNGGSTSLTVTATTASATTDTRTVGVKGTVRGARDGRVTVRVDRLRGGRWVTERRLPTRVRRGRFAARLRLRGDAPYRIVAHRRGSRGVAAAASRPLLALR